MACRTFQYHSRTLRWDGHQNGRPAPAGIYYYVVDFLRPVTEAPDQRRGSVTLLR